MAQTTKKQRFFPERGEIEYEQSVITIPLYLTAESKQQPKTTQPVSADETIISGKELIGKKGESEIRSLLKRSELKPAEVVNHTAYMRLIRGEPVTNSLGIRQFEFQIDAWELVGYSKILDKNITFSLSKTVQPVSICIADQAVAGNKSDYPAKIIYSAIYDVFLNDQRIIVNQPGIAFATGVKEIPPRDVKVAFEKPYDSRFFWWGPGWCWFMRTITRAVFEKGAAEAAKLRESTTYK